MVNTELILDLAKLVNKHGVHSFEELAEYIKSPINIENLTRVLGTAAKLSKGNTNKTPKKKNIADPYPQRLKDLQNSDPEKFDILVEFYQKLISKEILTSLRELNFFREDNGLGQSKSKSHNDAIKSLVNDLSNFSIEKLLSLETKSVSNDKGLQGWSDIILNRKRNIS